LNISKFGRSVHFRVSRIHPKKKAEIIIRDDKE
jgi:hypothetical protein